MKLIIITAENLFDGEASVLNHLFDAGMEILHLRKPSSSENEIRELLSQVDTKYHQRIVLHDHYFLADSFDVKGIHLNSRNAIPNMESMRITSRSCHTFECIGQSSDLDYVFLSPIFDSISKVGYKQAFSHEQLTDAKKKGIINERVIALGGIDTNTIPLAANYGFGGVAALGSLWQNFVKDKDENALSERFENLQKISNKQ